MTLKSHLPSNSLATDLGLSYLALLPHHLVQTGRVTWVLVLVLDEVGTELTDEADTVLTASSTAAFVSTSPPMVVAWPAY